MKSRGKEDDAIYEKGNLVTSNFAGKSLKWLPKSLTSLQNIKENNYVKKI